MSPIIWVCRGAINAGQRSRGKGVEMDDAAKELALIKLARWTNTYSFVNKFPQDSYNQIFAYTVKEVCSQKASWPEFLKALCVEKPPEDGTIAFTCTIWSITKKYRVRPGVFAPKISYKYLLFVEIWYVYSLFGQFLTDEQLARYFRLFRISKKARTLVADCLHEYPVISDGFFQNQRLANIKYFCETTRLLGEFICREFRYYSLPRKHVSVFATMGAGKSTFINALLGDDYLPSKNEACTAKIAAIADIDHIHYCLGYAVKNGMYEYCAHINRQKLEEWNGDAAVSKIMLEGNLDRISGENAVVVIHDTPGVTYSGNVEHKRITLRHIVDSKPAVIICLLDATQMFTTGFAGALDALKKKQNRRNKAHIIFVVNKADSFDPQKESLNDMIRDTIGELDKQGFKNPMVAPVSAKAARLFKMMLKEKAEFTRKEKRDYTEFTEFFGEYGENFSNLAAGFPTNTEVENINSGSSVLTIEAKTYSVLDIQRALFHTGIPVVEQFLNSYTGEKI
jgi:ribosome biogenesis GTPase A